MMKSMSSSVTQRSVSLFLVLLAIMAGLVDAQRSCFTPNNAYGQCLPYGQCSYFEQQIQLYGNAIPKSFLQFLRQSRCESNDKNVVFLCCESRYIKKEPTPTAAAPTTVASASNALSQPINQRGLSILSDTNCGNPSDNRVAFGKPARLAEFPWMALLIYNSPDKFNCGGSLITNRYVLTAAHCMVGQHYTVIGVRLGEHNIDNPKDCERRGKELQCSPPVEDYGVEKLIPHPMYKSTDYDIALIRLDREVNFQIHITPICLPITEISRQLQDEYYIAGWGSTENGLRSQVLLKAKVPQKPVDYCRMVFSNDRINENHICAGAENRVDSCKGDSGGPLFFLAPYGITPRFVQFGIVSHGVPECGSKRSYPTIYTKVESHLPWITNMIA